MNKIVEETTQTNFVYTGATVRLLEQISASIKMDEPVLLVGETGTGKTTAV
jgi:midasin